MIKVQCNKNCGNAANGFCTCQDLTISIGGTCKSFTEPKNFVREDNVVVMDKRGLPSIMVKFTRDPKKEEIHPMFCIGGEIYDEIYISKYKNCVIDGLAYSLPGFDPRMNFSLEEAEDACFSKGEGWHLMTVMEHGFLANQSLANKTLPHGNTDNRVYHGEPEEIAHKYLHGLSPKTWFHDHTIFGVEGLCGGSNEWIRGLRLNNGRLEAPADNDAAMPINLSSDSPLWKPVTADGMPIYLGQKEDRIVFSTAKQTIQKNTIYGQWKDVERYGLRLPDSGLHTDNPLMSMGLFNGEPNANLQVRNDGESMMIVGGTSTMKERAGIFSTQLDQDRENRSTKITFRSAYYRKR